MLTEQIVSSPLVGVHETTEPQTPKATNREVVSKDAINDESQQTPSHSGNMPADCLIYPSFKAFYDVNLSSKRNIMQDVDENTQVWKLKSTGGRSHESSDSKKRWQRHVLLYKGDVVWSLETSSTRSISGHVWGTTSYCHLHESEEQLFVQVMCKTGRIRSRPRRHRTFVFDVKEILQESAATQAEDFE